jgi:hypothetical protein
MRLRVWIWLPCAAALALLASSGNACAQGIKAPKIRDSNVGYIDPAIPGDLFRLRVDASYDNIRPNRADFFWSPGGKFGPGPSIPESSVNYQDVTPYLETLVAPSLSVFAELPIRNLDPVQNANAAGLSNVNFGLKYAFIEAEDLVTTFQFRTYVPTPDVQLGVGNGHFSLEPALLLYRPLSDRWRLEAEVRDWIPVDGTSFAGNIIRYGIGTSYAVVQNDLWRLSPVAEFVGWSILDGKESIRQPSGAAIVKSAAGEEIVNVKVGLRLRFGDQMDLYAGYGRPLTGDFWYRNTFRFELRYFF